MGIFDRLRKNAAPADTQTAEAEKLSKTDVTSKKEVSVALVAPQITGAFVPDVILAPRISEKAAFLAAKGTYVFNVPVSANKGDVRKAVERLYKVGVSSVRMVRGSGKVMRRGRQVGRRSRWKKALVSLKRGDKIDLYEGV